MILSVPGCERETFSRTVRDLSYGTDTLLIMPSLLRKKSAFLFIDLARDTTAFSLGYLYRCFICSLGTVLRTPVHQLCNANIKSANDVVATKCINTRKHGQEVHLFFRPNFRRGKKCDLTDLIVVMM